MKIVPIFAKLRIQDARVYGSSQLVVGRVVGIPCEF